MLHQALLAALTLTPVWLTAVYFGNPALSVLESDGILLASSNWASLRLGYMSDWNYRQRYNEEFHIAGTPNPSSYAQLTTNAATVTVNVKNWIDLNGLIGGSQLQIDHDVYTKRQLAWGGGAKLIIYHTNSIYVGLDMKYFSTEQKPIYLVSEGYAFNVVSHFRMNYTELQAAIGTACRIEMISPYLYASYLYSKINPNPRSVFVRMPTYDGTAESFTTSVIDRHRWGMAFGVTFIGGKKGSITVETRFFNQNALNVSGEIRF